ncbi:Hypothetical protein, conserved [Brucella abortus str. 2308 A]|nr:Hypothetical protein, conserved [Brucella suis ATCC 23445]ACD71777.1 hypothetical protein BAbS19_I02300 [Brucella abortus S19]ACU47260.1 hypothetical protein BMI_I245 [Brucella microti CCM 4915]AEK53557.1 hypothetical protein BPI_I243 [Brucella pinnipedialis B2/94]EEH15472.1 Hypothetical protein, conserved [Brucella ceti str. Cudo]EEP63748.1 Hypothetical protein, conserved [Brucella abortus str. 2308 A]EEX83839.1 predicted protein [Brucella abortus bv. 3 str. Tulya]
MTMAEQTLYFENYELGCAQAIYACDHTLLVERRA